MSPCVFVALTTEMRTHHTRRRSARAGYLTDGDPVPMSKVIEELHGRSEVS